MLNFDGAMRRRLTGDPLPWDPSYSPDLRAFVDGSFGALVGARGTIQRQAQQDPRTAGVKVKLTNDPAQPNYGFFDVVVQPLGIPSLSQTGANAPSQPSQSGGINVQVSTPTS
jgi:hypothetical protein